MAVADTDVVVAGGGPVGLAAAIEARLAGLDVIVVEKRGGSLDKACGEGLMPGAVPMLEHWGVAPDGVPIMGVEYRDAKHRVEHRFEGGHGLGVRRTELHRALRERAHALGAGFAHATVRGFTQDARLVTVELADGRSIRGAHLLGADGLHSTVSRLAGLDGARPRGSIRLGLRRHFEREPWADTVQVHFTGSCELYITPVGERLVGVAALGRKGMNFEEAIASVPEVAKLLEGVTPASDLRGAGPFHRRTTARVAGRVMLLGDASGYVDALTGEGLRLGFAQAQAAIGCAVRDAAAAYEGEWSRVTRDFRVLTTVLLGWASSPLRGTLVPTAARAPKLFGAVVERLAR